jgi:hypothetical protein
MTHDSPVQASTRVVEHLTCPAHGGSYEHSYFPAVLSQMGKEKPERKCWHCDLVLIPTQKGGEQE